MKIKSITKYFQKVLKVYIFSAFYFLEWNISNRNVLRRLGLTDDWRGNQAITTISLTHMRKRRWFGFLIFIWKTSQYVVALILRVCCCCRRALRLASWLLGYRPYLQSLLSPQYLDTYPFTFLSLHYPTLFPTLSFMAFHSPAGGHGNAGCLATRPRIIFLWPNSSETQRYIKLRIGTYIQRALLVMWSKFR